MGEAVEYLSSIPRAIDSSNIGFQLLKKCGWKEGTGLGVSEQGRLEPIQTHLKNNKRGLGAEEIKQKIRPSKNPTSAQAEQVKLQPSKKQKLISKRLRKMMEEEERMKEREFEMAFFREFWPDNV